jgi:hypothetical protein
LPIFLSVLIVSMRILTTCLPRLSALYTQVHKELHSTLYIRFWNAAQTHVSVRINLRQHYVVQIRMPCYRDNSACQPSERVGGIKWLKEKKTGSSTVLPIFKELSQGSFYCLEKFYAFPPNSGIHIRQYSVYSKKSCDIQLIPVVLAELCS